MSTKRKFCDEDSDKDSDEDSDEVSDEDCDEESDEDSENCADISYKHFLDTAVSDSDSSDIVCSATKSQEQIVIEDDVDDEDVINHQLPEHWFWKEARNNPKIWNYTETPGIKVATLSELGVNKKELDIFNIIFDNMFWENVVAETNRYAEQTRNNPNEIRTIDDTWFPVDYNEIKIYFALSIIMAHVKKPTIQMHWSKKAVIETPIFRRTMPLKRFLQITKCLHFANNNMVDNTAKLNKITPVTDFLNEKFKEVYTMKEDIVIDESLMKYKGRISCTQFNSSKRARFGITFYKLCESESGYCYDFKIYTDRDKINCDDSASESIVKELSQSVLRRGHTLYIDNWYSSPKLFMTLSRNDKTNVIGTVRPNRRNMPKEFHKAKLKPGEYRMRSCNGILALKWKDKRDVYIMSTKHETVEMTAQQTNQFNRISKPKCVIEYNKGMIGIDRQDQMLACFPIMRKCMKGYRKIFFYVFDIALFNSYILFNKINNGKKQSYVEYRIEIAESLLKNIPKPDYKERERLSYGDLPERLHAKHWGHFPKHIDPTPSKSRPSRLCKVCTKNKKRSETTWECKRCKVPLHIPICFEIYHTTEDY